MSTDRPANDGLIQGYHVYRAGDQTVARGQVDGEVLVESGDASVVSNNTAVAGAYPEPGMTPFRETLKWPDRYYRAFTTERIEQFMELTRR